MPLVELLVGLSLVNFRLSAEALTGTLSALWDCRSPAPLRLAAPAPHPIQIPSTAASRSARPIQYNLNHQARPSQRQHCLVPHHPAITPRSPCHSLTSTPLAGAAPAANNTQHASRSAHPIQSPSTPLAAPALPPSSSNQPSLPRHSLTSRDDRTTVPPPVGGSPATLGPIGARSGWGRWSATRAPRPSSGSSSSWPSRARWRRARTCGRRR